ncbi:MAG: DeoR/GlpR family DNA-binding transcription regulator [Clostridia bacterium]
MNGRQLQIRKILDGAGEVHLQDLRRIFTDVSEMTLRRDLSMLENEGYAIRTHGGAVSTNKFIQSEGQENEYSKRAREDTPAKTRIAAKAIRFIEKGRSIYLDAGSTVMSLAKLIQGDGCTFITSAVNTSMELSSTAHSVVQLGGAVNKNTLSCSGPDALLMMDTINIDIAIMSASGFSIERGFTVSNRYEGLLKQKVLGKAKKCIMLMAESKIDKDLPFTFASLEEFDYWVCDGMPGEDIIEKSKEYNVVII